MKKTFFYIILSVLVCCFIEAASFASLLILRKIKDINYQPIFTKKLSRPHKKLLKNLIKQDTNYITYSSKLGWTLKPNGNIDDIYISNNDGIRSTKDYSLLPNKNIFRIATFGDSFTHCDNVSNNDTWQFNMNKTSPDLEVLNFGIGGYGLDQAYLRYLNDGVKYNPHVVMICFMSENIFRHVNVFRPFYLHNTSLPLTKPYFHFDNEDKIKLINNPTPNLHDYQLMLQKPEMILPKLGKKDFYYQTRYHDIFLDIFSSVKLTKIFLSSFNEKIIHNGYYNINTEAYKITTNIFDLFYKKVIENNSIPLIILMPNEDDLRRYRENKTKVYQPLINYLKSKNYDVIDLLDAFEKYGQKYRTYKLFISHYSQKANSFIAKYLIEELQKKDIYSNKTLPNN